MRQWKRKVFYDFALTPNEVAHKFVSHDANESESYIRIWKDHDFKDLGFRPKDGFIVKITVEKIK